VEAYDRSLIPAPAYSLSLGRYGDESSSGSLMVVGGYDADLVDGDINWIKCTGDAHLQIPMDGIIVNGVTIQRNDSEPMQAIIDVLPSPQSQLT
jgi:Eukaryotic aspartyl protease